MGGDEIQLLGHKGFKGQLSVTEEGKSFYKKWRDWEIMYHVACLMNGEQQRRLIGNDVAMIFFHDSDKEEFNTNCPRSTMTQQFILVQPLPNMRYKVACFHRIALARFPPAMPPEPVFDCSNEIGCDLLRDF